MSVLTHQEREAALSQLTTMDKITAAFSKYDLRKRVPILKDGNEIWVAVSPTTRAVSADVPQPDPKRQVLYSSEGKFGNTCYCYADQLFICSVCTVIFAVISAIVFTPFSLICFIPMIKHLQKAQSDSERKNITDARQHCKSYTNWCLGLTLWIGALIVCFTVACLAVVMAIRFSSNNNNSYNNRNSYYNPYSYY